MVKTPEQIEGIRKSCQLTSACLNFIEPYIQPGISTNQIDKLIDQYIRDHNAIPATLNYKGYPKSCCTSINEVICHGIPSDNIILKEGDIIGIDVTTILNGYYGDKAITFPVGKVNPLAEKLMRIAKFATEIGIAEASSGNHLGNIGYAVNSFVTRCGFSIATDFCGHGVGIEFHEPPQVPFRAEKQTGMRLKPGMIFTIEPMVNVGRSRAVILEDGWTARTIDGKLSAQYEHTILVANNGTEILTESP